MPGGNTAQTLFLIVIMGALLYFMMIKPQKKRQEEAKKQRDSLKVGSKIVTIGGIRGTVTRLDEDAFEIETGEDHMRIEFVRQALSYIVKPVEGYEEMKSETEDRYVFEENTEDTSSDSMEE